MNGDFWHSDDDEEVLAEYMAEHASVPTFSAATNTLEIQFGSADRLPPMPEESTCAICGTPVRNRDGVGWVHEVGFREREGCTVAFPSPVATPS